MAQSDALAAKQWLDGFARASESADMLDRLVSVIDDSIVDELPEFADPTLLAELHASTRSHWKGFLSVVTRDTVEVHPAPQIYDLARTLARRGHDLPLLLAVYRIGRRATWQYITELIQHEVPDPAVGAAVLLQFWSHASFWIDKTVESLIVTFSEERDQWHRGELARNTALVQAILANKLVDVGDAVTALTYPLPQHHTAFTVRVDDNVPDTEVRQLLEAAARRLSVALRGSRPLIVSTAARSAWCWTATPTAAPPIAMDVAEQVPRHVQVTVGGCHPGLEGFRLSHSEAIAALTVAERRGRGFVRFADVELACLAAGVLDDRLRTEFVRRELRALADSDDSTERLRETLRAYLTRGGDATATGELLRLHPNTVRYRVRQAEKLLGHPIAQRRVQVELALEIVNVLGIAG